MSGIVAGGSCHAPGARATPPATGPLGGRALVGDPLVPRVLFFLLRAPPPGPGYHRRDDSAGRRGVAQARREEGTVGGRPSRREGGTVRRMPLTAFQKEVA